MLRHQLTRESRLALVRARTEAQKLGHGWVGMEHMLLALLGEHTEAAQVLLALGASLGSLREYIVRHASAGHPGIRSAPGQRPMTPRTAEVTRLAIAQARGLGSRRAGTEHLLLALLLEEKGPAAQALRAAGITVERLIGALRTGGAPVDFRIQVDDKSDRVIYEQIVSQIQEAIATGRLSPGDRLPPVRQLADDLGIAPGTVSRAYSLLEESGAVTTEGARGTFVAGREAPTAGKKDRSDAVHALLRQVVVAAFHLGATAEDLRKELEQAMKDIFGTREAA
jgi:GntR family transcriptional regulator